MQKVCYIGVAGKLAREKTEAIAARNGIEIVPLESALIFGKDHIESAISHAERAFKSGRNIAKSFGIEITRYASGERQISKALSKMCSKPESCHHVLLIVGDCDAGKIVEELSVGLEKDAIASDGKDARMFGLSEAELSTVAKRRQADLVIERVALLDLEK